MNIFNHYGIKEVADVTFYSITKIGEKEFYTPVLFFDTLKTFSIKENITEKEAYGGKGNRQVVSWNFMKDLEVSLEDALFSKTSMDLFLGGRISSELSDWTSAINKLTVANDYGKKHYSSVAFPSPTLSETEWKIVFRCAQKSGYCAKFGDLAIRDEEKVKYCKYLFSTSSRDTEEDAYVAENRKILTERYFNRNQITPRSYNLAYYYDFKEGYEGVDMRIYPSKYIINSLNDNREWEYTMGEGESIDEVQISLINILKELQEESKRNSIQLTIKINMPLILRYTNTQGETTYDDKKTSIDIFLTISPSYGYYCRASEIISTDEENLNIFDNIYCGNDSFNNHIFYYIFPTKLGDFMDLCYCDLQDQIFLAMPQNVIKEIEKEIDSIYKTGRISNDLYEAQCIDRFESCIVENPNGFYIDGLEQRRNFIKKQNDNKSENYTIYYDPKTMLPLFKSEQFEFQPDSKRYFSLNEYSIENYQNLSKEEILSLGTSLISLFKKDFQQLKNMIEEEDEREVDHIEDIIFVGNSDSINISNNMITFSGDSSPLLVKYIEKNQNSFKLKKGTRYLKWSRTIDDQGQLFNTIGTDLLIDSTTFPSEYMVVGETYIREQKTGKDQRCQIIFNRVKLSPSTEIKLEAAGSPVTFSMKILVLPEKGKEMIKMSFFDVEKDKKEGGVKVIPISSRYSYTLPEIEDSITVIDNNEIY